MYCTPTLTHYKRGKLILPLGYAFCLWDISVSSLKKLLLPWTGAKKDLLSGIVLGTMQRNYARSLTSGILETEAEMNPANQYKGI